MTSRFALVLVFVLMLFGSLLRAQSPSPPATAAVAPAKPAGAAAVVPPASMSAVLQYGERDVLRLKAKLRYTTLIVLPKNEQILDFTCGDKEFWIVNGSQNFAYVKPARANSQTNLNLITASGNVYSFVLNEVSGTPGAEPDLKVFVEPKEDSMVAAMNGSPRFVAASEVDNYRQQIELAKQESHDTKTGAQAAIERFRADYPTGLKFTYYFERNKKPFLVTAMYHDDRFTYIQASPQETPALYEIKDGKPNLINFDYRNGTYVAGKILDSGYLTIGKSRMNFTHQE